MKASNEPFANQNTTIHKEDEQYDIESGNQNSAAEDVNKMIRLGFIKKVYVVLSFQLLMTCFFVSLTFNDSIANFFNKTTPIFYCCVALSLIIAIALICFTSLARSVPTNYILLAIWTFCESWMVATASSYYDQTTVFIAGCLTAAVTISLTVYAFTTKTDFTFYGGILFACTCLMFFVGIFFLIFGIGNRSTPGFRAINIVYCGLGVLLFSLYLIYDTQLLSGKFGLEYSIDDYIIAAMMIYIDIIQLFLYILSLMGNLRRQ